MNFEIGNDRLILPKVRYRGRIAPTPTGFLHLGHARTFSIAQKRARAVGGELVYRCEDLDAQRCRPEFAEASIEDLRWLGIDWSAGPDLGEDRDRWTQSKRHRWGCYLQAWKRLKEMNLIYPCEVSRKQLQASDGGRRAPDALGGELIFPERLRADSGMDYEEPGECNWRFRVDYHGAPLSVEDGRLGPGSFQPGRDYGDFLVWRRDGLPSYELAVVVDDILMRITEVVRGEDLWVSTARQLELYRAFEASAPAFYHCALVRDPSGERLAKRRDSLAIRHLRSEGFSPSAVLNRADSQV